MFYKLILASVVIAVASSGALADKKKPVPPKPKVEITKDLEDTEQLLQFEVQSATSDQQKSKPEPKPNKLENFEIQVLM